MIFNGVQNHLKFLLNLLIGEPKYLQSMFSEKIVPSSVFFHPFLVYRPVYLHDKACLCTIEVNDKLIDRVLPSKSMA